MKKHDASDRAVALVNEAVDLLLRSIHAPASPVSSFTPANVRRKMRRSVARLRAGKSRPRHMNLHSSEELAGVLERTVRRDEILEQAGEDLRRVTLELGRILEENDPAVRAALDAFVREAKRSAEEHGPGSEAAERYRQLMFLGWIGKEWHSRHRRQRRGRPAVLQNVSLAPDPSIDVRHALSAAQLLASPPAEGETVVTIPPEGSGSGRERMFFRIGLGESSWVGSFERGHRQVSTICMMPDGTHLFVSAGGAGYVIEARSHTLVETIGMDVLRVICDEPGTLFVVDHGGASLEAFGKPGRLWKTDRISWAGFRGLALTDRALVGEARQWWRAEWVGFAVDVATGRVRVAR